MTPANECLHADLATRLDAANRLVMDLEFLGANRSTQVLLQFVALGQAQILFRFEDPIGASTFDFSTVKGEVRVLQQHFRIAAIPRCKRNTYADTDHDTLAVKIVRLANLFNHSRRECARIRRRERGDDGKFVSAQAGDRIRLSNAGVQSVCYYSQHRVADRMTQRIVHCLEAVEIKTEHGELPVVAATRQGCLESFAQQNRSEEHTSELQSLR